ncbi:MAG: TonB-dependent receptor [Azoarcus sp.]|nr:TonB-dependent receptor [Azoarcus sp.]
MALRIRPLAWGIFILPFGTALAVDNAAGADPGPAALGQVTVTAKGYAADTLETPASIVVVGRDELLRRNAANLGEAVRGLPGLAVASDGAQGQNPVVRGLKKESVVLLVDGMRLNSAQPAGAIGSFMALGLAERVEVVKGPASVLYGSGALGGAINVLLPQARFEPGMRSQLGASYDSASEGVRATGVLNVANEDHALMLGASLARIDDYRAPDGRVDDTGYDSDSFIGQYRFRIDDAQQLRMSLQQHTDKDVWYPGSAKPHPHPLVVATVVHSPEQTRTLAELGYSRKGSGDAPANLDLRVYRQEMEREIFAWSTRLRRNISETRVSFDTNGVDARADWLVHPQHLLAMGVNAWEMFASPARLLPTPNMPAPGNNPTNLLSRSDPFDDARIRALGFYVQDDMRFGDLGVVAGLRRDTVEGTAKSMANGAVTTGLDRSDDMWSGSLGAIWKLSPLLRPYVNLSRGVRAGEMRERYESSPRADGYFYVGNPQIKPEVATQFELGLKGADERFDYALSAYRSRITDYITGEDLSGTVQAISICGAANAAACKRTVNLGRVTLTGFEAHGRWQFSHAQWLNAGLSMVRGENRDLDEPLFQMPADELTLGWDGRVAARWTADVTLRLVREQDRVATVFSRGTENTTPGFVTADLGTSYTVGAHRFRVALRNLADRSYHEHLSEGVSGQEIKAPGRSLLLSYNGSF